MEPKSYYRVTATFRGFPKHAQEWWVVIPTVEALLATMQEFRDMEATSSEENMLTGLIRCLKKEKGITPVFTPYKTSFPHKLPHSIRTPIGTMEAIAECKFFLGDKDSLHFEEFVLSTKKDNVLNSRKSLTIVTSNTIDLY